MIFTTDHENSVPRKPIWRRGYDWFCGYNATEIDMSEEEKKAKLNKITSIEQDQKADILLYALLVFVLSTAVFIYAYFSMPT